MGSSQQFSLRWNNYLRHITGAFDSLRTDEDLVDVTLSCEGKKIRAHKMLLSACSSYFRDLFKENPCQHPVIIFRDVKYKDLEALVDFMYQGEVNVVQDQLTSFLNTAELLAVQGLTDGSSKDGAESDTSDVKTSEDSQSATQPEVKKLPASVAAPAVAANAAITTSNLNNRGSPDSPVAKKRKCGSGVGAGFNDINKEEHKQSSDLESMEVIPVLPNVKVEQPEYYEQERVGHYGDSVREQSIISGNLDSVTKEEKKDSADIYSSNSSDKSQHSNPLLDINQVVMGVSGPSLDVLPQEPLQEIFGEEESEETVHPDISIPSSIMTEESYQKPSAEEMDNNGSSVFESEGDDSVFEAQESGLQSGEDPKLSCDVCREAKTVKKDPGCPRCPICPNHSATCSHLLKIHMRDVHGWFTVQRRFNMF